MTKKPKTNQQPTLNLDKLEKMTEPVSTAAKGVDAAEGDAKIAKIAQKDVKNGPKLAKISKNATNVAENRPSTRQARTKGAAEGQLRKKNYLKLKAYVLKVEPKNYSKLILLHEKDGWWKMFGHSALMFHYDVAKWINYPAKLLPDSDYDHRSEEGVVNIRDIFELDSRLAAVKINVLDMHSAYRTYNIGKKYSPGELEAFQKTKDLEEAKVNKIIIPKQTFPDLYTQLRDLTTKVYFTTRLFNTYARAVMGEPMLEAVVGAMREYSLFVHEVGMSREEYLQYVVDAMHKIEGLMAPVVELRLVPNQRIFQILKGTNRVIREVEQCQHKTV